MICFILSFSKHSCVINACVIVRIYCRPAVLYTDSLLYCFAYNCARFLECFFHFLLIVLFLLGHKVIFLDYTVLKALLEMEDLDLIQHLDLILDVQTFFVER